MCRSNRCQSEVPRNEMLLCCSFVVAINLLLNQSEKCYDFKFQIKFNKLVSLRTNTAIQKQSKHFSYGASAGEDMNRNLNMNHCWHEVLIC